MKTIQSVLVSAALAVATAAPASAGVNDPEIILYRVSGVLNGNGATAFFCTNFSGVNENIRIVIRNADSPVLFNGAFPIAHLNTLAATTKGVGAYGGLNLALGAFQGTAAIAATSVNITCTAMQVDAASSSPQGIALHMTRFNPIAGTQE
jgi:hypothetical protein